MFTHAFDCHREFEASIADTKGINPERRMVHTMDTPLCCDEEPDASIGTAAAVVLEKQTVSEFEHLGLRFPSLDVVHF